MGWCECECCGLRVPVVCLLSLSLLSFSFLAPSHPFFLPPPFTMTAQVDLNFDDVRMAVLVQAVVPAQYAFVIHTKNPSNNDEKEVFCELVRGLGERGGKRGGGLSKGGVVYQEGGQLLFSHSVARTHTHTVSLASIPARSLSSTHSHPPPLPSLSPRVIFLPPGESLVSGMVPGSSVAFKALKDKLDSPEVLCYASKSEAMFVPQSLIFRSDSNGEDLEGYAGEPGRDVLRREDKSGGEGPRAFPSRSNSSSAALAPTLSLSPTCPSLPHALSLLTLSPSPSGAGLYESITMDPTITKRIDYMDDKLVQDPVRGGRWGGRKRGQGSRKSDSVGSLAAGTQTRSRDPGPSCLIFTRVPPFCTSGLPAVHPERDLQGRRQHRDCPWVSAGH